MIKPFILTVDLARLMAAAWDAEDTIEGQAAIKRLAARIDTERVPDFDQLFEQQWETTK